MKILGICHDVFICSACVVIDGKVAVAIPEERIPSERNKVLSRDSLNAASCWDDRQNSFAFVAHATS